VSFDEALANAAAAWYGDDLAEALTYNGDSVAGHIERTGGEQGPEVRRQTAKLHVRKSQVPAPAYRDSVVDEAGTTWRVIPPVPADASAVDWVLTIEANVAPGFGR
jgi:hypothetical protein